MTNQVFVTGGAGFIGRAVVRQLRERADKWAMHGKATAELGYNPRPLSQGAMDAFGRG